MIIGNNQKGTVRDTINNLRGDKEDSNANQTLGNYFRKDEYIPEIKDAVNMEDIDPDDRGTDFEDNNDWKEFY